MSIFAGTDAIINRHLFGDSSIDYRQVKGLRPLGSTDAICSDTAALIRCLYDQIVGNWQRANTLTQRKASAQNWRFTLNPSIGDRNLSREKQVEKRVARLAMDGQLGHGEWANQVPVASGLLNSHADKKSCIDLVHRRASGCFDFIELKMDAGSGHALFAAMEILRYGLLFLFSKRWSGDLGYDVSEHELLKAQQIRLVILAPSDYYLKVPLDLLRSIPTSFNRALPAESSRLGLSEPSMAMTFEQFPDCFRWPCRDDQLVAAITQRQRAYPS